MNIQESKNLGGAAFKNSYEKAQKYNEKLNAIVTFVEDEGCQNQQGLLANVPVAVKDNFSTKGVKTTACSNILANYQPVFDATAIKKLKEAGAKIFAKASMDELAMGGTNLTANIGPCHNPYDLKRISGGSSGGSAVLVASGVTPLALGSDTGDSVRKPAAYCGIVGTKPSYGRISRYGVIPYASSLDHVAYFTGNVYDAALALEVLAGRDDLDMTSSYEPVLNYSQLLDYDFSKLSFGVIDNVIEAMSNQKIKETFLKLIHDLEAKGAKVKHIHFDNDLLKALFPTYFIIANAEASANHSNLDGVRFGVREKGDSMEEIMINSRTKGFSSFIKKRFVVGSYSLFEENQERLFRKAQKVRRLVCESFNESLKDVDVLIAPASGQVAPLIQNEEKQDELTDEYLICENYMVFANFAGLPSITLPMGFVDDLPVGVNLSAKAFDEVTMFRCAKALEDVTGLKDLVKEDF